MLINESINQRINKSSLQNLSVAVVCCLWVVFLWGQPAASEAPAPVYPVPTEHQLAWHQMEIYAFAHFGLNTFTDKEWGYGNVDPKLFNPSRLDCDQWAQTLVNAGLKGIILTAKHHDGFCLWPSMFTDYSIRQSPFRGGDGDLIAELQQSCRKYGLKMGLYNSPWDRHQASYGSAEYVEFYYNQWRELLLNYGPLFEVWIDGANGGDGWYGGAEDSRSIDKRTYYQFDRFGAMVDRFQPQAMIFSDGGPGCRWVGNENGVAGETNWAFLRHKEVYPGYEKYSELTEGHADGDAWIPAECDVSIRPSWFYHESQDTMVKSVDELVDLYFQSVGHGANLLINFPINQEGRISANDSANIVGLRRYLDHNFKHDYLQTYAKIYFSSRRPSESSQFSPFRLVDDNPNTYWATEDGVNFGAVTFQLRRPAKINCLMLQEYLPLGQRVQKFSIEVSNDGRTWRPVQNNEQMTTIGYKRLVRFKKERVSYVRVTIHQARGPLCISRIGAFCVED